ncbi:FmdB family zinc ribbon protein [Ramlibacter rhizophilus]|uniref:Zinc ribbon domain-containing protein n=1 Tax=Ramlibacter rhizophilus TaxID=1781167 RepID=A0A4Z0BTW7_9BURK|nr:FmdB family zinc ribbon protein [Ramlibacter rhizophilus]TFZ01455.1 zinc ribbon domain-containing protein [Ramlibacter rhizophilus]
MPIYAYKCGSCGHAKDVLQKVSDAPLTACPACGAEAFSKQITAAGFQLKGSGWYVTDFRNGSKSGSTSTGEAGKTDAGDKAGSPSEGAGAKPADAPATKSDGPAASAGGCGSACACH